MKNEYQPFLCKSSPFYTNQGPLNPRVERARLALEVLGDQHDVDDIHHAIGIDVE